MHNNKLNNLEITSQRENSNKKHIKSSSKYVGVAWYKAYNKWSSEITINRKKVFLGYFINEKDAYYAYQEKLKTINAH